MQNQGLGSQGEKIYVESTTKNTPNTSQLISTMCPIWNMLERRPYWVSEIRASNQQCNLRIYFLRLSHLQKVLKRRRSKMITFEDEPFKNSFDNDLKGLPLDSEHSKILDRIPDILTPGLLFLSRDHLAFFPVFLSHRRTTI